MDTAAVFVARSVTLEKATEAAPHVRVCLCSGARALCVS